MADKNAVVRWLLAKRPLFNPKFTEFDWPKRYAPGLFDFATTLTIDGLTVEGRGVDIDPEVAIEKSACEAIERLICLDHGISSVGVAVGGATGAIQHAENEARERYFLGEHLKTATPFRKLANQSSLSASIYQRITEPFHASNPMAKLNFYQMATEKQLALVCQVQETTPLSFYGFALSDNLEYAISHSLREALVNFARFKDSPATFDVERARDSNLWHLHPQFLLQMDELTSLATEVAQRTFATPELETERLSPLRPDLDDCPVHPVRSRVKVAV